MTAPVLLQAVDLWKLYPTAGHEVAAVQGASLALRGGELLLLMGPSGSGKTTLLCLLAGLLRPTRGQVLLCGQSLSELPTPAVTRARRERLGFVFQSYNLFPALTALDNVATVLKLKGLGGRAARQRAAELLERVGLGGRLDHLPAQLSGGQKQRVAIARALSGEPPVILGDEITAALDLTAGTAVMELLRGYVGPERAVLLVTHDLRMRRFADRVLHMEDGRLVSEERQPSEAAP